MLLSALEQDQYDIITRVGHNLKGTSTPYGFPQITQIGGSLERAGRESDRTEATRNIGRLMDYLNAVEVSAHGTVPGA